MWMDVACASWTMASGGITEAGGCRFPGWSSGDTRATMAGCPRWDSGGSPSRSSRHRVPHVPPARPDHLAVELAARLDRALLGREVHVNEAHPVRVEIGRASCRERV